MTNEERSKLRREALEVKEEKKVKKGFFTSTRNKIIAGITLAFTVAASSAGTVAVMNHINNDAAVADTTVEDTKEIPNDRYYTKSETKELEQKITDYFNSLDEETKSEFDNNPQYLIDFGKWINGLEVEGLEGNGFTEAYIGQIYENIGNVSEKLYLSIVNDQPIEGTYIKPSVFIKDTHPLYKVLTDRENWLDQIVKKGPHSTGAFEVSKEWTADDLKALVALNYFQWQETDQAFAELLLKTGLIEKLNFNDLIFKWNNCKGIYLATPDGEKAFYPIIVGPHDSLGIEIDDESKIETEMPYFHLIVRLLQKCDNYYTNGNAKIYDQDPYTTLYRTQIDYINQKIVDKNSKTESTDTSKLEEITTAKENAYLLKEMAFNYIDKNGTKVRVHSNIINS